MTLVVGTGEQPGRPLAAGAGVTVVRAASLTADLFAETGLATAQALALVAQDDTGNLDTALLARELNPTVRIVVRMFHESLADGTRTRLRDCAVLSESAIAAPGFLSAALGGEAGPAPLLLPYRRLVGARREHVRAQDIQRGLAVVGGPGEDIELLPEDEGRANLVLAEAPPPPPGRRPRRPARHPLRVVSLVLARRLRIVIGVVAVLLLAFSGLVHLTARLGWWASVYVTVLTVLGGANPDLSLPGGQQAVQTALTAFSVALIPALTAAVVDAVVHLRLARLQGAAVEPRRDHLVVVGLGNLGTRVLTGLHDAQLDVVGIDPRPDARGVQSGRALGIPVIVGDPTQEAVLRAACVHTCRALLVLSTDDVRNLQTALLGRSLGGDVRVVLRLFDADFADRVERAFGLTISRSVSGHPARPRNPDPRGPATTTPPPGVTVHCRWTLIRRRSVTSP